MVPRSEVPNMKKVPKPTMKEEKRHEVEVLTNKLKARDTKGALIVCPKGKACKAAHFANQLDFSGEPNKAPEPTKLSFFPSLKEEKPKQPRPATAHITKEKKPWRGYVDRRFNAEKDTKEYGRLLAPTKANRDRVGMEA